MWFNRSKNANLFPGVSPVGFLDVFSPDLLSELSIFFILTFYRHSFISS